MSYYIKPNELYHHGILGQKWGIRRYQNENGSLTEAGKRRYYSEADAKGYNKTGYSGGRYKLNKKGEVEPYYVNPNDWVKSDIRNSRNSLDEASSAINKIKNVNNSMPRLKSNKRMDLSSKTDKELRDRINRELLEKQYNDMFSPKKESRGREYVDRTLSVAGTAVGIASSALAITLAIKELRG